MAASSLQAAHHIGTLNEKPLHAALKAWYARPGDRFEVLVDGSVVDIVRGALLVEVQTRNFASIRGKLFRLASCHPVRLVYPIARQKWIVRSAEGRMSRRQSPKHGAIEDVFHELVSLPRLLANPNFSIDVLFTVEEELRRHDSHSGWRRRGWVCQERRLLEVVGSRLFETGADVAALIPGGIPEPFATADLAEAIGKPLSLAQKMAYCLREMRAIVPVGRRRNAFLYVRAAA
jgi:hypothetical protein